MRADLLRQNLNVERVEFLEMMERDESVFTLHSVDGTSRANGNAIRITVITLFVYDQNKIIRAYVNGATEDAS